MGGKEIRARCPTCGKRFLWDPGSPFRPFCSERCQLIDLGEWMDEGHRIPDEDSAEPFLPPDQKPDA